MGQETPNDLTAGPPVGHTGFRVHRGGWLTLVAVAVALLAAAAFSFVITKSPAAALEGRRVCSYIEGYDDTYMGINVKEQCHVA